MNPRACLPALILIFAAALSRAFAFDLAPLDAFITSEMKRAGVPGASVAIVLRGEVIYARGFGLACVDTGEPVKSDMLFRIGSTTKMFTAATLVSLVEEGKAGLEDPVGKHVTGLAPKIASVTLHQLLTHSAGLSDETFMEGPHDETALGEWVRNLKDSLVFESPGKIYSYSNPGFWIAGFAAESIGGKRYADLVTERVLQPCGMTRSTFRPTVAMTWPLAVGHEVKNGGKPNVVRPLADNAGGWPAGQLFTTAPEFARFCTAFMEGGKLEGKQVLSGFVIEKLSTPHVAIAGRDGHYGYGLNVRDENGLRWLSHGGSRTGYGSSMKMCPEKKFAVIVLANLTGAGLPRVADRAAEIVLGTPSPAREPSATLAMSAEEMHQVAGNYSNGRTTLAIKVQDGKLVGAQGGEFSKIGENHYRRATMGNSPDSDFIFSSGLDGSGAYLIRQGRALKKQ